MRKVAVAILLLVLLVFVSACLPSYKVVLKEQIESDNVTPITLEEATEIQSNEVVITFVIKDSGISVDKVVNIGDFYAGAEADVVYMIRNETDVVVKPEIYFDNKWRVGNYSAVDGQGYVDAPAYVEGWIKITPDPSSIAIPLKSAQGYIISLIMPDDAEVPAKKMAFVMSVTGRKLGVMQPEVGTWFLVSFK